VGAFSVKIIKKLKKLVRGIRLNKYKFNLVQTDNSSIKETDHIIPAHSLADAIQKFVRKYELEAPAYWDEPFYDRHIELAFKSNRGALKYHISW
jgi:hypothetical protein